MNPYSINTLQKKYSMKPVSYEYSVNLHKETLSIYFVDKVNRKKECYNFISNGVLFQSWMSILDFNDANNNDTTHVFQNLKLILELLQIDNIEKIEHYKSTITSFDNTLYLTIISQVLELLKKCFELRPASSYLYPNFYQFLVYFYEYNKEKNDTEKQMKIMKKIATDLLNEIHSLPSVYENAREYIKNVLLTPFEQHIKIPMYQAAFLYQTYCLQHQQQNFYSQCCTLSNDTNSTTVKNWYTFLETIVKNLPEKQNSSSITSFQEFCSIEINLMLANDMNLRKCKNCGGYFCVKYSSNQEYCTRNYSEASTCSEYASRKTYKDKLFEHPISSEYTKAYNKLYARIRRKKLPPDTPLKEELLKLRSEYMERYEQTHKKDREAVNCFPSSRQSKNIKFFCQ